jgi:hypothetical protein
MWFLFFLLDFFTGRFADRTTPIRCDGDPDPQDPELGKSPIGG